MKIELSHNPFCRRVLTSAAIALSLVAAAESALAQGNSPTGTWDCVISGTRNGLASLVFSSDTNGGTFNGFEIIVPKGTPSPRTSLIAGLVAGLGSNGLSPKRGDNSNDNSNGTNFFIFGASPVSGNWAFDAKGRIVGSFVETVNQACTTETNFLQTCVSTNIAFAVTNFDGSVSFTSSTNFTLCFSSSTLETNVLWSATNLDGTFTNFFSMPVTAANTNFTIFTNCSSGVSNVVNFIGKVIPGKRLTLTGRGTLGRFAIRGVPSTTLTSLSGSWLGTKKQNRVSTFELFTLGPLTNSVLSFTNSSETITNPPNAFAVTGSGPGYFYTNGLAVLSSQKKLAMAFNLLDGNSNYLSTRAVIGAFNARKSKATLVGIDGPSGAVSSSDRVVFQVQKRSSIP